MDKRSLLVDGQILLYGDVGDPWGWGDGFTPVDVAAALAEHGQGDVTVRINSGGGIAFDGVAIYSLLKAHAGQVEIVIDGIAASAASLIAMSGDRILMRSGAMMMIHDASGVTFGTSAEHEKSAKTLDKISDQYASIYAQTSGMSKDDVRPLMLAETWLSADEAVAKGFATGTVEDKAAASAAFDYTIYAHAPAELPRRARTQITPPAAVAAQPEKPVMALKSDNPAAGDPAVKTPVENDPNVKAWAPQFYALAEKHDLSLRDVNAMVQSAKTLDEAKDSLIDALAKKQTLPDPNGGRAVVSADERDKFIAGVTQAFLAQGGVEKRDPANEFNGITPMKLAEMAVRRAGVKAGFDRKKIVATAITHSTSDFPLITQNIAEKAMLKGYEEQEETFQQWTSRGTLSDFKQGRRVGINALPSLPPVNEAGEFEHVSTGERGEPVQLGTFGEIVTVTRQLIINDDLGVFVTLPRALGRAARRTVGDAVYAVLTSNPNMADGNPLFHASHRNNGTGAGSALQVSSLIAANTAMGTQPDRSNPATALNISPRWLLVPKALQPLAKQLMDSTAEPGATNGNTANRVAQLATVIADARLDRASTTGWYLAANQGAVDTIEVQYLDGVDTPYIEQAEEFDVDGMKLKVRIDFGVKALQWEGLYRAVGA